MTVDVTITATLRPEILSRTLDSFFNNVFYDVDVRAIINIDLIGEEGKLGETIKVVEKYFGDSFLLRTSEEASFPKAVIWCWGNSTSTYVFHLEEDWICLKKVSIPKMISILDNNKNLACLRLCKFPLRTNLFGCKYTVSKNKDFLIARIRDHQFGLNPVLIKRSFVLEALKFLSPLKDPEKQFRPESNNKLFRNVVTKWDYGIIGKVNESPYVEDIGRKWMKENNFIKNGVTWKKLI
jgi:hypothetical protein